MGEGRSGNVIAVTFGSIGKTDGFERVEIEVFFRSNKGRMGAEESGGYEEGLVAFFGHELDRFGSDHAVGLFFVRAIGSKPTEGSADLAMRFGIEDEMFVGFVAAVGIDDALPGWFVVEAVGANAGGNVIVVDFPDAGDVVAILDEVLGKGDDVWDFVAKVAIEIVDFDLIGTQPGHDGGPTGVAERELVVGPVESDALGGEAVDVGSFDDEVAVAAEGGGKVVDGDEEDVGAFGGGGEGAGERRRRMIMLWRRVFVLRGRMSREKS